MIFNKTGASIGVGVTLSPPQTVSHGHVWKRGRVRKEKVRWQSGMPGTHYVASLKGTLSWQAMNI